MHYPQSVTDIETVRQITRQLRKQFQLGIWKTKFQPHRWDPVSDATTIGRAIYTINRLQTWFGTTIVIPGSLYTAGRSPPESGTWSTVIGCTRCIEYRELYLCSHRGAERVGEKEGMTSDSGFVPDGMRPCYWLSREHPVALGTLSRYTPDISRYLCSGNICVTIYRKLYYRDFC